jgi:hypothetical protein
MWTRGLKCKNQVVADWSGIIRLFEDGDSADKKGLAMTTLLIDRPALTVDLFRSARPNEDFQRFNDADLGEAVSTVTDDGTASCR